MDTIPLDLSATFENRELATTLVRRVTGLPLPAAHSLVLTADATATAVLRTAGIPTGEARPILAALWRHPARYDEPPRPSRRPLLDPDDRRRERLFVRDLGQRLHVIRHARRLTPTGVQSRTGTPAYVLRDIESCRARRYLRRSGRLFCRERDRYLASRRSWSTYQLVVTFVVTLAMRGMAAHTWLARHAAIGCLGVGRRPLDRTLEALVSRCRPRVRCCAISNGPPRFKSCPSG